jgi:hypothetical protein
MAEQSEPMTKITQRQTYPKKRQNCAVNDQDLYPSLKERLIKNFNLQISAESQSSLCAPAAQGELS